MVSPGVNVPTPRRRLARFGTYEFDLTNLKLFRKGRDVGLQNQPAMLLAFLVNRAGNVVTRAELRELIWPNGTYVEFDFGLNTTVNRLRRTLRDSATEPSYIETVPKQGYRFIAPVELILPISEPTPELTAVPRNFEVQEASIRDRAGAVQVMAPASPGGQRHLGAMVWILAGVALLLAATLFVNHWRDTRAPKAGVTVSSYLLLPRPQVPEVVVISPEGDQIVYQVMRGGVRQLYRRSLADEESHLIPGSEGATQPFFSPDGQELGFYTPTAIRVTGPHGNRDLVSVPPEFDLRKAIWGEDQFVYYTTPADGIWRVPAKGGQPQPVVKPVPGQRTTPFYFPQQVLYDAHSVLIASTNSGPKSRSILAVGLSGNRTVDTLVAQGMGGQVIPSGRFLYFWGGKLFAAPFDMRAHKLTGSAVEVLNHVAVNGWRGPAASVSNTGTLVYLERKLPIRKLLWIDCKGHETPLPVPAADYEQAEVSPDGTKVSLIRRDLPDLWTAWIYDLLSGGWTRILDLDVPVPRMIWSPDSKQVVISTAEGEQEFLNLYRIRLSSPAIAERLTEETDYGQFPGAWSAAANAILFTEGVHSVTQSDIFALLLSNGDHTRARVRALVATKGADQTPAFSRDGRWFAYATFSESNSEVFVQKFDQSNPPRQVSVRGGSDPAWSPDGSRLYFLDRNRALMELTWTKDGAAGEPRKLLPEGFARSNDWWTRAYSIAPNGRFLVLRDSDGGAQSEPRIRVIVNWPVEMARLGATGAPN